MAVKGLKGIKPTRIEFLKLKKRELIAQRGHDLLEEKRDAMVMEFLRIADEYGEERRSLEEASARAFEKLTEAQMLAGSGGVWDAAEAAVEWGRIGLTKRHIMGVPVERIGIVPAPIPPIGRGYGYAGTTAAIDEAADAFGAVLIQAIRVAEIENAMEQIAAEIKRTKRRVNALETILIPQIQASQRHIEAHLDELAREDLFRRKRTKLQQKPDSGA